MDKVREQIITEATKWLGAHWHHAACVRYQAVDCAQILADVYSAVGLIEKPDYTNYPRDWAAHRNDEWFMQTVMRYAHRVEKPLSGDVVLFKIGRTFSHGAIVVAWPLVIHADMNEGVAIADIERHPQLSRRDRQFWTVFKE